VLILQKEINEFCYLKNKYIHNRDVRSSAMLVSVGL